jgi:hypothetical protein
LRVARLGEFIASLPELAPQGVDRSALAAAGLYHDAGWVLQVTTGAMPARELLLRPTTDIQRELAADWLEQQAGDVLPPGSLQRAIRAVRECGDRRTDLLECRILADADNLDNIGLQAMALMFRKFMAEGRAVVDLVAAWDRQEEYHYWQARIKECFHFPAVREIAERRYEALRRCMHDLRVAVHLEDLALVAGGGDGNGNGRAVGAPA